MTDTIKLKQWPVQSQSTHQKWKGDQTGDTSAGDMKCQHCMSAALSVNDNKTRMKWHKILVSNIMTLSGWNLTKSELSELKWVNWNLTKSELKSELSGKQTSDAHKLNKNDLIKVKRRIQQHFCWRPVSHCYKCSKWTIIVSKHEKQNQT